MLCSLGGFRPVTDLWEGVYYCMTLFTTIGYGNIAPTTNVSRLVTMLYAIIGIPLLFIILNDFGDVISRHLIKIWFWWIKKCLPRMRGRLRNSTCLVKKPKIEETAVIVPPDSPPTKIIEPDAASIDSEDELASEKLHNLPMSVALGLTVCWMLMCAAIFCSWEDWSYFTAFYFFFVSLTTIGLGDKVPRRINYMIISFWLLLIGLSLVSMCIQVAQAKVEFLMQQMLLRVSKASQEAQIAGGAMNDSDLQDVAKNQPRWMKALLGKKHQNRLEREIKKQVSSHTVKGTQTDPPPSRDREIQTLPMPDMKPMFWEQQETISRLMASVNELEQKLKDTIENDTNCNIQMNQVPEIHRTRKRRTELPLKEVLIHRHDGANLDSGKELLGFNL